MTVRFDNFQQVNYLAHAYLSFGIPDVLAGNLISDFVKGKQKLDYPLTVRTGINLHRAIDTFTDNHPVTRRAKSYFRPDYGLYSGPITDIVYDHFLANDPLTFPTAADLPAFARQTYVVLASRAKFFPDRFSHLFPYMRNRDWFTGYRTRQGIFSSLGGLSRRAAYMPDSQQACRLFELHYAELGDCYQTFFPELKDFALRTLQQLQEDEGTGKIG